MKYSDKPQAQGARRCSMCGAQLRRSPILGLVCPNGARCLYSPGTKARP